MTSLIGYKNVMKTGDDTKWYHDFWLLNAMTRLIKVYDVIKYWWWNHFIHPCLSFKSRWCHKNYDVILPPNVDCVDFPMPAIYCLIIYYWILPSCRLAAASREWGTGCFSCNKWTAQCSRNLASRSCTGSRRNLSGRSLKTKHSGMSRSKRRTQGLQTAPRS